MHRWVGLKAFPDMDRVVSAINHLPQKPTLRHAEQSINNVLAMKFMLLKLISLRDPLSSLTSPLLGNIQSVCLASHAPLCLLGPLFPWRCSSFADLSFRQMTVRSLWMANWMVSSPRFKKWSMKTSRFKKVELGSGISAALPSGLDSMVSWMLVIALCA